MRISGLEFRRVLFRSRVRSWAKTRSLDPVVCAAGQEVAGPDATAELNQMRERYRLAVDGLPPRSKEVYLLLRVEALGYRHLAEQLSIRIRTVACHFSDPLFRICTLFSHSFSSLFTPSQPPPFSLFHSPFFALFLSISFLL